MSPAEAVLLADLAASDEVDAYELHRQALTVVNLTPPSMPRSSGIVIALVAGGRSVERRVDAVGGAAPSPP